MFDDRRTNALADCSASPEAICGMRPDMVGKITATAVPFTTASAASAGTVARPVRNSPAATS